MSQLEATTTSRVNLYASSSERYLHIPYQGIDFANHADLNKMGGPGHLFTCRREGPSGTCTVAIAVDGCYCDSISWDSWV